MNKILRQFLILVAVFIAGLFFFSNLTNHERRDMTTDLAEATLPVVYLSVSDQRLNELHGYTKEMDAVSMRDTITPVEAGGVLPVEIDTYGEKIEEISFEIRSLDTTRLVQQSAAEHLKTTQDTVTAELPIQNLLSPGEEYLLILQVKASGVPCYFYTRITQESNSHIGECISFVKDFHEITMDRDRQSELASYMEPQYAADNSTLQTVTINNSLSQACWGDFAGEEVTDPVVLIKELNDSYNVILLSYILSSTDENGGMEYYNVEEYYRVRYGTEKIYLLSFERTVEEIFRGESSEIQGSMLNLGIRSKDVDFMANETGMVVCFVQQGELWSYNLDTNRLTRVYSFRGSEEMDIRENYNEHDIRIVRASESGSVDFIVYGYMNRGDREGQVGISVCHYDCMTNTVEEQLFIPSAQSYQIMKEEIGQTMYISDTGNFFFVMGDQVHQVNLATLEDSVLISGLTTGNYKSSADGQYLAWTKGDAAEAEMMYLTDFESGETKEIPAGEGNRIKPLGFLQADCVYGLAAEQNISHQSAIFPMHQVIIVDCADENLSVLKTYNSDGCYVTGAQVEDGSITLQRMVYTNGSYVETTSDTIRNRDMQEKALVYVSEIQSGVKQRQVVLQLSTEISSEPSRLIPKLIISEESTVLELSGKGGDSAYYVYAKGKVLVGTDHVTEAIACADENRGVVIGENQSYVWKRAKKQSRSLTVPPVFEGSATAQAVSILLSQAGTGADVDALLGEGKSVYEILSETVPDRDVYNLTGCTLEQVLYYVGEGSYVYGVLDGNPVVLTGYDENSAAFYDPASGRSQTRSIDTLTEDFAAIGNQFYVIAGQ